MIDSKEKLTLETIKGGALVEQFNIALGRVLVNILDINTTTTPREISMVIKISPNDDRTFLELSAGVKTKLAGQPTVKATADLSVDDHGRAVAFSRPSNQLALPFEVAKQQGEDIAG